MARVLVLELLELLGHLVGLICAAYYAVAHLLAVAALRVAEELPQASWWALRLLLNTGSLVAFLALAAAPWLLGLPAAERNAGLVGTCIALPLSRFYVRTRLGDKVAQMDELALLRACLESVLDLGAAVCAVLAVLGVSRIPYLFHHRADISRRRLYVAAAMTPFDYLGLLSAALVAATWWRFVCLERSWARRAAERPGVITRAYAMHGPAIVQLLNLLLDVVVFLPCALFALTWPPTGRPMLSDVVASRKPDASFNNFRGHVCRALGLAVDAWMAAVVSLLILPFVYRLPGLYHAVWRPGAAPWMKFVHAMWQLINLLFFDLPGVIAFFFVVVTGYRLKEAWIHRPAWDASEPQLQIHWIRVFLQLVVDLFDLPFLLLAAVITLTVWRFNALSRATRRCLDAHEPRSRLRMVILGQFGLWLCDLPVIWIGALLLFTWRSCDFVRDFRHTSEEVQEVDLEAELLGRPPKAGHIDHWALHKVCLRTAAFLILDVFVAPAALVCLLSWRSMSLRQRLRLAPLGRSKHLLVMSESLQLLIDVPHILLGLLCLWRLPALLRQLLNDEDCNSTVPRRRAVRAHALLMLLDIPCTLLCGALLFVPWRLEELHRAEHVAHCDIFVAFGRGMVDAIFYIPASVCLVVPWNLAHLLARLREQRYNYDAWRMLVWDQSKWAAGELLAYVGAVLVAVTLLRLPQLKFDLETGWSHPAATRNPANALVIHGKLVLLEAVGDALGLLVVDLMVLFQAAVVVATGFRLPSLLLGVATAIKDAASYRDPLASSKSYGTDGEPEIVSSWERARQSRMAHSAAVGEAYDKDEAPWRPEEAEGIRVPPPSLSLLHLPISLELGTVVVQLPQLLRLPIKVVALLLLPADAAASALLRWLRFGNKKEAPADPLHNSLLLGDALAESRAGPQATQEKRAEEEGEEVGTFWARSWLFTVVDELRGDVYPLSQFHWFCFAEHRLVALLACWCAAAVYALALALAWVEIGMAVVATAGVRLWLPMGGRRRLWERFVEFSVADLVSLQGFVNIAQVLALPAFAVAQLPLLLAPLTLFYVGHDGADAALLDQLCWGVAHGSFWTAPGSGTWLLQGLWLLLLWPHVIELVIRYLGSLWVPFLPFHALVALPLVLAKASEQSLIRGTHACHATSSARFLFLGQFMLIPVYVVSGGWPLLVVLLAFGWTPSDGTTAMPWGDVAFCAVAGVVALLSCALYLRGYRIIRQHWGDVTYLTEPQLHLDSVRVELPGVGVKVTLHASKAHGFRVDKVWLDLGPDQLWSTLQSSVRLPIKLAMKAFRRSQLPYLVPPHVMPLEGLASGAETRPTLSLSFGCDPSFEAMLNTYIICKRLTRIAQRGDNPPFEVTLTYERLLPSGTLERGVLCKLNTSPESILRALDLDLEALRAQALTHGSNIDDVANPARTWGTGVHDLQPDSSPVPFAAKESEKRV